MKLEIRNLGDWGGECYDEVSEADLRNERGNKDSIGTLNSYPNLDQEAPRHPVSLGNKWIKLF